jgi:hypothetical protein
MTARDFANHFAPTPEDQSNKTLVAFSPPPDIEAIASLPTAVTPYQPTVTRRTIMLFCGLLGSWLLTSFVLVSFFSSVCSTQFPTDNTDGFPNQSKSISRDESQLAPRDDATSLSTSTQTSLVTVTFTANFTIDEITYTPTGISSLNEAINSSSLTHCRDFNNNNTR